MLRILQPSLKSFARDAGLRMEAGENDYESFLSSRSHPVNLRVVAVLFLQPVIEPIELTRLRIFLDLCIPASSSSCSNQRASCCCSDEDSRVYGLLNLGQRAHGKIISLMHCM